MSKKSTDSRVTINLKLIDNTYNIWYAKHNLTLPLTNFPAIAKLIKSKLIPWVDKSFQAAHPNQEPPQDLLFHVAKVVIDNMPHNTPWPLNNPQTKLITILSNLDTAYNHIKNTKPHTPKNTNNTSKFDQNGQIILD